ncbi:MAG: helix-turn-helix transcriptional regulator [Anaerotignum sp.]|nr:helix-turn-helix transcriptional regulator [Anaerotignum sp.]MBR5121929.1 helix-turn-helix transcriptional regulator [Anaerotignum sp.]
MSFAKKLRNLRELSNMSQKELSDKIGVSTVMISQYENGKKMPARPTLNKIADVFGVTTSELLGEEENETPEEMIILNRAAKKMTPEKRKQLLEIVQSIFKEEFKE